MPGVVPASRPLSPHGTITPATLNGANGYDRLNGCSCSRKAPPVLVFECEGVKKMFPRPASYKEAIAIANRTFNNPDQDGAWTLFTRNLHVCEGDLVMIGPEAWDLVINDPDLKTVLVEWI